MQTAIATLKSQSELLAREAEELGGGNLGKLLKFSKGKYFVGDNEVKIGTQFIAHVPQYAKGWIKFQGKEVVDRKIGKICDGFVEPARDELDENDSTQWEKDDRGDPRDPWVQQSYLPLENIENGEMVVFVSGSSGGRGAIADLLRVGSMNLHRGLPSVQLDVTSYKHRQFGRIEKPLFKVTGWTGGAKVAVPALPERHPAFDPELDDSLADIGS